MQNGHTDILRKSTTHRAHTLQTKTSRIPERKICLLREHDDTMFRTTLIFCVISSSVRFVYATVPPSFKKNKKSKVWSDSKRQKSKAGSALLKPIRKGSDSREIYYNQRERIRATFFPYLCF